MGMARTSSKSSLANYISSHDEAIIQQIKTKHGTKLREFEFKPLMHLVQDIFHHSIFSTGSKNDPEDSNEKEPGSPNPIEKLELRTHIRYTIHQLALEMTCKCAHRKDVHETALVLLDLLHDYSWEAKVVLILSAFAMTYGEFWLTAQPSPGNPLLQSVSMLKQSPCLLQTTSSNLKSRFEALHILVEQMLDMANYIVDLRENRVPLDETSTEAVQFASYLIIISVVTCISSNIQLVKINIEYTSLDKDIQVLKKLHHMLAPFHGYLHELYSEIYSAETGNRDQQSSIRPHHNSKMADAVLHLARRTLPHSPLQQPRWKY
ncbi:hypothetical protein NE237_027330 [Protea cynaroides]|uniref:Sieve element occlusion N-terminal domain-containing protein n=1 Tax=Protea cynaroides TaxID=273540 RepID=A0A9Q0GPX6_9MAGN|nr:hypothetical protein NE237_027330 [Protea cynaroides]